jgi:hypothetical protein
MKILIRIKIRSIFNLLIKFSFNINVGPPRLVAPDAQYASVLESVVDVYWL